MSILGENGVKTEKIMKFIFASKFTYNFIFMPLEHFQEIFKFSLILITFLPYFFALFDPSKWVWPLNTSIRPYEHIWAENKKVDKFFGLNKWSL